MQAVPLLAHQLGGLGIGGALVIGAGEQADDAQQDGLGGLDGTPSLCSTLVPVLILLGWVQDRDAELAIMRVDVGVEGNRVLEEYAGR